MSDRQTIADVEARLDRLADFAAGFDCDVQTHVVDKAVAVQHAADLTALLASHRKMREENEDLRSSVVAFCAPWAVTYAREHGLPDGHLFANHYDILERAGARMVDFTRHVQGDADA